MNQNLEFTINHDYVIIMKQTVQTNDPLIINRIEIGQIIAETNHYLILKTMASSKRYIKKSLITKLISIENVVPPIDKFIDRIAEVLI